MSVTEATEPESQSERLVQLFDETMDLLGTVTELMAAIEGRRRDPSASIGDLPGIAARARRLAVGVEGLVDAETETWAATSCGVKS